jgi:diguanylate cyclase (GGDEF)-like protein
VSLFSLPRQGLDRKLTLGLGLMLVPLIVTGVVSIMLLHSAGDALTQTGREAATEVRLAIKARDSLKATEYAPATYAASGSPTVAQSFRVAVRRADAAIVTLRPAQFNEPQELRHIARVKREWRIARANGLALVQSRGRRSYASLDGFYLPVSRAEVELGHLAEWSLANRELQQRLTEQSRSRVFLILIAVMLASCVLAAVVARSIRRSVARPLHELRTVARRFGTGDFHARVSLNGSTEFAQVAAAFNGMADELRDNQAQLVHQAFHDPLTALPNRALLHDRTEHALARERRGAGRVAALFLDVDDFKGINDTLGHSAGDRLLVEVARRLRAAVRTEDTVARLGGDEFAVLIEGCRPNEAVLTAERILQVLGPPVLEQGRELSIGASIGVAMSETGATDADELLRHADIAMYVAKEDDKGGYRLFECAMHEEAVERLELEADLRVALARSELDVHYQPIFDLQTRRMTGVEALARWTHPDRGAVPPVEFIPVAERTGLIVPLGRWMLERACRDLRDLRASGEPSLRVSVNVSAVELMEDDYVAFVARTLEVSGISPQSLVLEITERVLVQDSEATLGRLRELKAIGVRLAVDDFGTGYSSLAYVERLPLDIIKIDKAFVDGVADPDDDGHLASVIVSLGDRLNLETVAEGIEVAEQGEELERLGCRFGQGYYLARPQTLEAVRRLIVEGGGDPAPDAPIAAA